MEIAEATLGKLARRCRTQGADVALLVCARATLYSTIRHGLPALPFEQIQGLHCDLAKLLSEVTSQHSTLREALTSCTDVLRSKGLPDMRDP